MGKWFTSGKSIATWGTLLSCHENIKPLYCKSYMALKRIRNHKVIISTNICALFCKIIRKVLGKDLFVICYTTLIKGTLV